MDVSIVKDEATGLPALPEGCFWRVGYSELSIMRNAPAGKWSDWGNFSPWRSDRNWDVESRWVRLVFRRFPRIPLSFKREQFRYRTKAREVSVFVKRYGEWDNDFYHAVAVDPDPMTRENLHDRACDVYYEWQQKLAEDALVGDYPPKVFSND